jgi:hypothetical protein
MNATEKMPRKAINKLNDFMCSPYFPFTWILKVYTHVLVASCSDESTV